MKKWMIAAVLAGTLLFTGCSNHIADGVEALETEDYEKAKTCFEQEIAKKKHLDEAYRGLGIAYFEMEEYEEAVENFQLALDNKTEETAILYSMMGACYMENDDDEKALDVYTKALSMKELTEELKQEIQYNLIAVYENMADWEGAKKQMEDYRKAYPDDERVQKEAQFLETR